MNTDTPLTTTQARIEKPRSVYFEAVTLAARLLKAKLIRDERNKTMCICLQYIGDNGPCPVHGPGLENRTVTDDR